MPNGITRSWDVFPQALAMPFATRALTVWQQHLGDPKAAEAGLRVLKQLTKAGNRVSGDSGNRVAFSGASLPCKGIDIKLLPQNHSL